jgi:hypothetical protein
MAVMEHAPAQEPDEDGGPYGVFGEGRPRHIVGDSDEPPRRRPRRKPDPAPSSDRQEPERR